MTQLVISADDINDDLWIDGQPVSLDNVNISDTLRLRYRHWQSRFKSSDSLQFDYIAFASDGIEIAHSFKREHPTWHIIYVDYAIILTLDLAAYNHVQDLPAESWVYRVQ